MLLSRARLLLDATEAASNAPNVFCLACSVSLLCPDIRSLSLFLPFLSLFLSFFPLSYLLSALSGRPSSVHSFVPLLDLASSFHLAIAPLLLSTSSLRVIVIGSACSPFLSLLRCEDGNLNREHGGGRGGGGGGGRGGDGGRGGKEKKEALEE